MIANRLNKINILNSVNGLRIGGKLIEPDFQDYLNLLTMPLSAGQKKKVNKLYVGLKDHLNINLLSDVFDVMYYLGNETPESSLMNLVKNAHHCTAVNAPVHTPYEGFAGDGISSYIDTNYNPATQAVNYALDDCAFGIYSRTDRAANDNKYHGVVVGSDYMQIMLYRATSSSVRGWVNTVSAGRTVDHTVSNTLGMSIIGRSASNSCYASRNKSISSDTDVSNGIPNGSIFLLARNAGGARGFDDVQLSFAFAGKYLDSTSVGYLTDDFEALMDSNGKGVIA